MYIYAAYTYHSIFTHVFTRIYMYTGMWDRTITVSSAGKTFSVTGWQVGWAIGPANLIRDMQTLLPYVQFCAATPMQESLVRCLKRADQVKVRREHILVVRRHILVVREHILAREHPVRCLKPTPLVREHACVRGPLSQARSSGKT